MDIALGLQNMLLLGSLSTETANVLNRMDTS